MNTVEDRLREALRERASHSPIDPDAWERTVARSRRRRWAWTGVRHRAGAWSRFLIPAAAAAAVVAVVVGATVLTGRVGQLAGPGRSPTAASPTPPAPPGPNDYSMQSAPPVTQVVRIKLIVGGQPTWTFVWFGYLKTDRAEGLVMCTVTDGAGYGGGGGCAPENPPAHQVAYTPGGYGAIRMGTVLKQVASVSAHLAHGRSVPGIVVSGRGFPYKVWAVSYSSTADAQIIFRDARGRQIGTLAVAGEVLWPHRPNTGGIVVFHYPAGTEGAKAGVMTGYLIGGKVAFYSSDNSDMSMSAGPAAGPPAVGLFQGNWNSKVPEVWFYGYAHENVARVVLQLSDGRQYSAQTFAAWPGSGLRLWAFAVPTRYLNIQPRKDVFTGYDAAGRVVWQQRPGTGG